MRGYGFWRRGIHHRPLISYYRQAREVLAPHWKKIGVGGLVLMVLILAAVNIPRMFDGPKGTDPSGKEHIVPPTDIELSHATQLELARKSFAPWQILLTNNGTEAPALLMFMGSGSTDVSDWTTEVQPGEWLKSEPFSLRSLQVSGKQATLTDSYGNLFKVSVDQPFMFEADPDNVYFVDDERNVWSTSFSIAAANRVAA